MELLNYCKSNLRLSSWQLYSSIIWVLSRNKYRYLQLGKMYLQIRFFQAGQDEECLEIGLIIILYCSLYFKKTLLDYI